MEESALKIEKNDLECFEKRIYEKLSNPTQSKDRRTNLISDNNTDDIANIKIRGYNDDVLKKSEEAYIEIVRNVVEKSGENLSNLRKDKQILRDKFVKLFSVVLIAQLIVLFFYINN